MFKRSRTNKIPTRTKALAAIPVVNSEVTVEKLENGDLLITYPTTIRPFFLKWARRMGKTPKPVRRKLQLDELGTWVWNCLDGHHSVEQIISKFAHVHQLHPKEAEVSVTQFLRALGQRGLIGMR